MNENKVGRPLKFKSAKELQQKIDEYFELCFEEEWHQDNSKDGGGRWVPVLNRFNEIVKYQVKPFTISGLALYLDTNRQTLLNYEHQEQYFDTITRAKAKIENYAEEQLFDKSARNINGIQFNLNNNFKKWSNKQDIEHSGTLGVTITDDIK